MGTAAGAGLVARRQRVDAAAKAAGESGTTIHGVKASQIVLYPADWVKSLVGDGPRKSGGSMELDNLLADVLERLPEGRRQLVVKTRQEYQLEEDMAFS